MSVSLSKPIAAATKDFSFKEYAWQQFKQNKPALYSLYIFFTLIFLAVFADIIANDQPLTCVYKGERLYPAFSSMFSSKPVIHEFAGSTATQENKIQYDITPWKQLPLESAIWALFPYSPTRPDKYNRDFTAPSAKQMYKNSKEELVELPWSFRHHLGTDQLGRDVLSGLIHGTRVALKVGIISVFISALIGIILGALSGFYGDTELTTHRITYYLVWLGVILGIFYGFIVQADGMKDAFQQGMLPGIMKLCLAVFTFIGVIALMNIVGNVLAKISPSFLKKQVTIPIDSIVSRTIEVLNSTPKLLLIISIAAIFKEKSLGIVMAVIGLTSWTGIARFTRAEFLRTKNLEFIQASKALGYTDSRTIFQHALPNSFAPVFIDIAFSIAAAILAEASLSFLGIGVPDDMVTWGTLLSSARQQFEAYWLVIYPGLAIFITVTIYNLIGEGLRDALDPKLKT